jgi:energy-coupling factor transporter ATP-binding protein EcfA2
MSELYNLHTLGWRDFQNLSGTILREILGQTYQTFSETADAGRDGAFFGRWKRKSGENLKGAFVAQCKFIGKSGAVLKSSDVTDELSKARRLASKGLCANYLLLTNASLSARTEQSLRTEFLQVPRLKEFRAFGGEWITQQIRENRRLRTLVPRVYGLGDLTEILDDRIYDQAKEILSWLGDELEKFVVTDSHHRSVRALESKGFVFLLGDAGSGKSTIAAALALAAADTWKSRVVKVRNATDFTNHWNPTEPNQFFWVDDAFGQRQFERERTLEWNHALPHLSAALRRGARAIFTSRTYIYKAAVEDLKESIFPLLRESRVVIEVEKLTKAERQQIVYNHMRLGTQPREFRSRVKPFLPDVASHEKFLPETARRLGNKTFTKGVKLTREGVVHYVTYPEEYLRELIEGLGDSNRAALGLLFMRGGKLRARLELSAEEDKALKLLNSPLGAVRKSLRSLEGSLLVRELESSETIFRFKHPTVRDAFGGVIGDDVNLMDIYLRGARAEMLIEEVTCGDVGLKGAKLVVPPDRFQVVVDRLHELRSEPAGNRRIASFLTERSTLDFVKLFISADRTFLQSLDFRSWLIYSPEARLFGLLQKNHLLSEAHRCRFVEVASRKALLSPEWRFMRALDLRKLFKPGEIRSLRAEVRRELTSRQLALETEAYELSWEDSNEDPEDFFWSWNQELDAFADEFYGNRVLLRRFVVAENKLTKLIEKLRKAREEKEGSLEAAAQEQRAPSRSIFDDVDQ